jgi:hypothetical protein
MHQTSAKSYINSNAICDWMDSDAGTKIDYSFLSVKKENAPSLLKELIRNGACTNNKSPQVKAAIATIQKSDYVKKSLLTKQLGSNSPQKNDRRFAILSTLETRYADYIPQLTLGTIIKDGSNFLLCLLPSCDCARVPKDGRNFLFIELIEATNGIDLIVQDGDSEIDLAVSSHPYDTKIYRFAPNEDGTPVVAQKKGNDFLFEHEDKDKVIRWVAELKPQIAQAFANEYAARVSRVGVSKSQWLHALGKK